MGRLVTHPDRISRSDIVIGDNVHLLMRRHGITQTELAPVLGLGQSHFGRKIRGKIRWYASEVADVATIFDVTVDQLLGNDPLPVADKS